MPTTFWADCAVFDTYNQDTFSYVEKQWGVKLRIEIAGDSEVRILNGLSITVRDYPEIMTDIEKSGYFEPQAAVWQVNRISADDITLYLVNSSGKADDGRKAQSLGKGLCVYPDEQCDSNSHFVTSFFINESLRSIERKSGTEGDAP